MAANDDGSLFYGIGQTKGERTVAFFVLDTRTYQGRVVANVGPANPNMAWDYHKIAADGDWDLPNGSVIVTSFASNGCPGSCRSAGSRVSLSGVGSMLQTFLRNARGISVLRLHSDSSNWPLDGKKSGAATMAYAARLATRASISGTATSIQPSPVKSLAVPSDATLGAASVVVVTAFGWWGFLDRGWLIDPAYPAAGSLAVFSTGVLLSFRRADVQRKQVREIFSHYLAPAMVKRLEADPSLVKLGGEVRNRYLLGPSETTLGRGEDKAGVGPDSVAGPVGAARGPNGMTSLRLRLGYPLRCTALRRSHAGVLAPPRLSKEE